VNLDTYTVTLEATRTDGVAITVPVTTSENIAAFATTATMTNKADKYPANMVIVDNSGNRIASIPITVLVVKVAMDENAESIEEDKSLYQQYTGTVQTLIADIRTELTDLKKEISSVCTVFSPYKGEGSSNVGDCTVISANGLNIIIDFGHANQYQTLAQNLLSHGYSKFDYAIVSHYHSDHIGGLRNILTDSRFDFSDCKFYVPPTDIDFTQMVGYDASGVSYATPKQYAEKQTEILALIEQYTAGYVVTSQNQVLSFSQFFKCKFFTCGSAAYSALYQVANEQGVCIINNFSMCCLISFGNTNMLFSGDIEKAGQSYAYVNIDKDIDFYKVEHHALDVETDSNWLSRITPRYALIQGSSGKDPNRVCETLNHLSNLDCIIVSNGTSTNAEFCVTVDDIGLKGYGGDAPLNYMRYVTAKSISDIVEIAKASKNALINFQLTSDTSLDLPFNALGAVGEMVINPAGTYGYAKVISYNNAWLATWSGSTTATWEKINGTYNVGSVNEAVELAKEYANVPVRFVLQSLTYDNGLPFKALNAIGTIILNAAGTYGYAEVISYNNAWLATWSNSTTPVWEKVNNTPVKRTYYFGTADLVENSNISPFSYYGEKDISSDLNTYGRLMSVIIKSPSTCPVTYSAQGGKIRVFSSRNTATVTVEAYYDSES
jgi:hypothetical protein